MTHIEHENGKALKKADLVETQLKTEQEKNKAFEQKTTKLENEIKN